MQNTELVMPLNFVMPSYMVLSERWSDQNRQGEGCAPNCIYLFQGSAFSIWKQRKQQTQPPGTWWNKETITIWVYREYC